MPVTIKTKSGKVIKGYMVDGDMNNAVIEYINKDGECRTAEGIVIY